MCFDILHIVHYPGYSKIAFTVSRPSGSLVIDFLKMTVLIHNLKTAWPTKILMLFFEFLGEFIIRYIYFFLKKKILS